MQFRNPNRVRRFTQASARGAGLEVFDYDGVVADVAADPANVVSRPESVRAIEQYQASGNATAMLSARYVPDLRTRVPVPGSYFLGAYGRTWAGLDGDITTADSAKADLDRVFAAMEEARTELDRERLLGDGVWLDRRDWTFAVDYRPLRAEVNREQDPDKAAYLARVQARVPEVLSGVAARNGIVLQPGRSVMEVGGPGWDKRSGLHRGVELVRADGREILGVAAFGDDPRDYPMFEALDDLERDSGGRIVGMRVLVDNDEAPDWLRESADVVLDGTGELPEFIDFTRGVTQPLSFGGR